MQILPDGGHATRSPATLARALEILLDIAAVLRAADRPSPSWLADAIDRGLPMLSFFHHGDGAAAAFNGAGGETWAALDTLAGRDAAPAPRASQSGFVRLAAGGTLVIMDVGGPAAAPFDRDAHAGALSFEFSQGRERLIVNCGAQQGATPAWRSAQRATAAHSTVVIDDTNSSELTPDGVGSRRAKVDWSYDSEESRHWVTAQHDGYAANFSVTHHRRLFLAAAGDDLRGEDRLTGAHRGAFAVRFHLHPSVKASLVHNGAAVLLRAADGGAWRLQASGAPLSLAESIYFGDPGPSRRSEQIVLTGPLTSKETVIKWALRRADPR